jgi:hypothetical protein
VDITYVWATFAAIIASGGFLLYLGTIGLKGDKEEPESKMQQE